MTKPYETYKPHSRTARLMAKARAVNAQRDAIDISGPVARCPLDLQLRTALSAIFCGLETRDWDCVAEGTVMIQDAEAQVRTEEHG